MPRPNPIDVARILERWEWLGPIGTVRDGRLRKGRSREANEQEEPSQHRAPFYSNGTCHESQFVPALAVHSYFRDTERTRSVMALDSFASRTNLVARAA